MISDGDVNKLVKWVILGQSQNLGKKANFWFNS